MAIERSKFLESKEIKSEDIIAGFRAARAIPIQDLRSGFLNCDAKKTLLFQARFPLILEDEKILSDWAKRHFVYLLSENIAPEDMKIVTQPYTARELVMLGYIYEYGVGVKSNTKNAKACYELAASQGDAVGLYEFADILGFDALVKAATENLAACNSLGDYYRVTNDISKAGQLYATTALQGSAAGLYKCGVLRPVEEKCKFLRLAAFYKSHEALTDIVVKFNVRSMSSSSSPIIYHAAHVIIGTKPFKESGQLVLVQKAFFELCKHKPNDVKQLSQELNDTDDEMLSILDDEALKENLAILTNFLSRDTFGIVLSYLDIPLFFSPYLFKTEETAKEAATNLLSKGSCSSLFFQSATRAEKGKISYQEVMRNTI